MAEYSEKSLTQKLGLTDGMSALFVNAPENYYELLGQLPKNISKNKKGKVDFIHFFTRSQEALREDVLNLKNNIKSSGMLWISWPKSSCSFANSNLTEHVVRQIGLDSGLVDVKIASIDDDWSGLKFVYRVKDR